MTAIFPGYYTGRATHIHTKVFPEWTPHENGTFSGKRLIHVGQFFFEDEMNLVVDKVMFSLSFPNLVRLSHSFRRCIHIRKILSDTLMDGHVTGVTR